MTSEWVFNMSGSHPGEKINMKQDPVHNLEGWFFFFFAPHRLRYVEGCSVRMTFSFVLPKVHGCIGTENEAEEEITSIGKIAS